MGIAVHAGFFLFAAAIAMTALAVKISHVIHEHTKQIRLGFRAR
jgi:hypothetical protein